jgi:acyl carrier protein
MNAMSMNLEERVIAALRGVLDKSPEIAQAINPASRLLEDLEVDSLDRLMIISALEDEFSLSIAEDDFLDVVTVGDIIQKLQDRGM